MRIMDMVKKAGVMAFGVMLLIMIMSLAAAAKVVQVSFWNPFTGPDGEVIERMVNDFNRTAGKEQGVSIDLLVVPWEEYYTKLTVAMASGTVPNLAIAHSHRIAGFVKEGALLEFSPDSLAKSGIKAQDYIPALWKAGEIGGKRYAVPIDAFPRHLYYDRNLFKKVGLDPEKPPQTLDELIASGLKITNPKQGIWGLWFGLNGSWVARDFYTYFWQFEPNLLSSDQKELSSNFMDVARRVFQIQTDFISKYKITPPEPGAYGPLFAQGKLGVAVSQITELGMLEHTPGLDFGAAPMPLIGEHKATYALGHNFILPKGRTQNTERIRAANVFIEWFARHGLDWAKGGKVPASFPVLKDKGFAELRIQRIAASQLEYMKVPPLIPEMPAIDDIIIKNGEAIYARKATIDDAVKRMVTEIEGLLSKK